MNDGTSIFEVMMLSDQYGNRLNGANPTGTAVDAFGRSRISQPITLFDSFNRYQINQNFIASTVTGATVSHDTNTSSVLLNTTTTSGSKVVRESTRVFAYQPGKSLLILTSFIMSTSKTNLTQRVGYFNDQNGIYLEQANSTINLVVRSFASGSATNTVVNQANWNMDKLDGTGPSKLTLDLTKAQIMFIDLEWLGVGTVRCGFVVNGQMVLCHSFHHANIISNVYMTTACLPIRLEIENTGVTASSSTLRHVCSSVMSEGGYELRGRSKTIGLPINAPYDLTSAATFYPIVSLRLKTTNLDAIVVPKNISLLGIGNNTRLMYKLVSGSTITGGTWVSAAADSAVEYNITAASYSGGNDLTIGYTGVTTQSSQTITLDAGLFKYQLERNGLTNTPLTFTLVAAGAAAGDDVLGSIDWDEIT